MNRIFGEGLKRPMFRLLQNQSLTVFLYMVEFLSYFTESYEFQPSLP